MFSIIVAVLFAIRIYSNSLHCLPKVKHCFQCSAEERCANCRKVHQQRVVDKKLSSRIRVFSFDESGSIKGRAKHFNVGMRNIVQQ